MAYININRDFRELDFYINSTLEQKAIIQEIIWRVQFAEKEIRFDNRMILLKCGDLWISSGNVLKSVKRLNPKSDIKPNHYRYAVEKMVKNGFLKLLVSSRKSGSIYACLERFYSEIAMPFGSKIGQNMSKNTANRPQTNNQPTANRPQTNNKPNSLTINELEEVTANQQQTNRTNLTNTQHEVSNNISKEVISKEISKGINKVIKEDLIFHV